MAGFSFILPIGPHVLNPAIHLAGNFAASRKMVRHSDFVMPSLYRRDLTAVRQVGAWLTRVDGPTGELFLSRFEASLRKTLAEKVCDERHLVHGFNGSIDQLLESEDVSRIGNLSYIIGESAISSIKHAVYPLYKQMIASNWDKQDEIAKSLATIVNVLGLQKQKILGDQKSNAVEFIDIDNALPNMCHGLFKGLVLNNVLFEGGDKGMCIWFSPTRSSSIYYATEYRDRDQNDDNMTTGDLQEAINPIPLDGGVTLEFSTEKLLEYGVFKIPPFKKNFIISEEAFSGTKHVPFNALILEAKKGVIRFLKLPLSFISAVKWMDAEWVQAANMLLQEKSKDEN